MMFLAFLVIPNSPEYFADFDDSTSSFILHVKGTTQHEEYIDISQVDLLIEHPFLRVDKISSISFKSLLTSGKDQTYLSNVTAQWTSFPVNRSYHDLKTRFQVNYNLLGTDDLVHSGETTLDFYTLFHGM